MNPRLEKFSRQPFGRAPFNRIITFGQLKVQSYEENLLYHNIDFFDAVFLPGEKAFARILYHW
jgi:hypothetical protein